MIQLCIVALLIPAGFLTPPKKVNSLSNTPNLILPENFVDVTFPGSNCSAT